MTETTNSVSRSRKLGPEERAAAIASMRDHEVDVLVIGGGIVGTGAALDAVTRGLRVGLIEARDFASGTSSRSSKLIHGGIRYLEQLNFGLVREALIERGLLLQRIAPHLAKPVRFLYPLEKPLIERAYIGAGMALYDAFSYTGFMKPGVPMHRHLTKKQVLKQIPSLDPDAFVGGLTYYDAQVDDARYVAELARTASFYGAHVASRVRAEGFLKVGERVVGVQAHDYETGELFEIRAKQVVNATGVWTGETQAMVGARGEFKVRASKGVHLVVPRDRFHSEMGLLLRTEKSVLFVIPWGRHWILGTTDTDWNLDKAHPAATAADIDYILDHVNRVLATKLTRSDVEGVYAGLRPLLAASGEGSSTANLSREHYVSHPVPGLVLIAGGKWTTYRIMAKDAIDEAVERDGRQGAAVVHRPDPAARRRRLPGGLEQAGEDRARVRRAQAPHRAPAEPLRHPHRRAARHHPRSTRSSPTRCRAPTTTSAPRCATPARTRAPCTSTTCSRGARASRSRRGTAASPRRRSPLGSWRMRSAGTTHGSRTRSTPTTSGSPRSSRARSCRTTSRPTARARRRPRSCR